MATISTPQLAGRLRLAIARTARRLRQEAATELTLSQTAALATVERHGPLTPGELAARERIQRPTATRVIARLETSGLLARTADPLDGRSSLISITPAGVTLLRRVRNRKDAYLAQRLERLDAEDRAVLERAAAILERVLEEDERA